MSKILVIDDDPIFADLLKMFISEAGHDIEMAANGEEGVEKMHSFVPDLVLVDIMMPVMGGYDFLLSIMDHKTNSFPCAVIAMSAGGSVTATIDIKDVVQLGVEHILRKPLDNDELISKIDELLAVESDLSTEAQSPDESAETEKPTEAEESDPLDDSDDEIESDDIEVSIDSDDGNDDDVEELD